MVVYLEFVFLDNFIIDLLLITLARKSLNLQVKKKFIVLSALVGALVAIVYPLLNLGVALGFALKMPIAIVIVLCSGKFSSFKQFIYCFYLFLFFTFLFGGAITAVFWGLGLSFDPLTYANLTEIPIGIIIVIAIVLYLLIKKTVKVIYRKKTISAFTYRCQLEIDGKAFEFSGFLDSGNSLIYRETGSPVVVCSKKASEKIKKTGAFEKTRKDILFINTVSGKSVISVYKTTKFLIYNGLIPNILYNVMIGVSSTELSFGEYDLLLGPALFGGIYD